MRTTRQISASIPGRADSYPAGDFPVDFIDDDGFDDTDIDWDDMERHPITGEP